MRFLDYLFHGKELKAIGNYFKMLNGYSPTFTSFSGGVYEMDLTRTAVNNFATHCSKLKPEIEGSALKTLEKTLQHKPNYFMDTTKFIKRLATYVAVEHTAFIIPIKIKKVYDVSAVSIPANNDTEISARNFANRSYEQEKQELLKRRAMILKIKASL